jgi:hypothetical protein
MTKREMNSIWKSMAFPTGETTMFKNIKLGIIRHTGNVWTAYVGNRRLSDSKSKSEAHARVIEEIDIGTGCSREKQKKGLLMDKEAVIITEQGGAYGVQINGITHPTCVHGSATPSKQSINWSVELKKPISVN